MIGYTELLLFLRQKSYQELDAVHRSGDFFVKGDTITWWPVTETSPFRYHYFDEELEKAELRTDEKWITTELRPDQMANQVDTEHGTIRPGEYIVHPFHGVGIFVCLEARLNGEKEKKQFVTLQYAGNDILLFPFDRYKELMPYIGSRSPRLTRLYSKLWQKTKEKIQKDLIKIARELLKMYAKRQLVDRTPYPEIPDWQDVLYKESGFELTEDQDRTLSEIQKDFAGTLPMDRLICGDVGFGKTELALRAAAQVIASGKQVAFIAPTTVLAEQHYVLLVKRFASLPIRVDHISRLTASKDKEIQENLRTGRTDLIVGTHRLLSKDIQFKDLGLLILDEEQKFGVEQKESLKAVRPSIDVLSLSATPIPRTLSISLSGIRSLSILRTPPFGRLPVTTTIVSYNEEDLQKTLCREIERNGQTYVVHNRVQSLGSVERKVAELLEKKGYSPVFFREGARSSTKKKGEIVIASGHGQMGETALAETMSLFLAGEIDILVASTIVEYGLDSPKANSLVVLHSEWFGLSDLYQLRGRVGRRQTQAYATFFIGGIERNAYKEEGEHLMLSKTAKKRLDALKEADTLGSGWSIALKDLEIRGGGNILGHQQHGSMETIGLLLYAELLQEEIGKQAKRMGIRLFEKQAN